MFRCMTDLKGLIIDVDGFDESTSAWEDILELYDCVFITSSEKKKKKLRKRYQANIIFIPISMKVFSPMPLIHKEALEMMQLKTTEVAYVSANTNFLQNALCFFSGTILVRDSVISYDEVGYCPDLRCGSLNAMKKTLQEDAWGFFGEAVFSSGTIDPQASVAGCMPKIFFEIEGTNTKVPVYMLGRYFGSNHYMNQLHPYSTAISLNKRESSKAYGVFNPDFAEILSIGIKSILDNNHADCICHVPVRPGKKNRFSKITEYIANNNDVEDISNHFICTKDYESQKSLSQDDRRINIRNVFSFNGTLENKSVILYDDIMTTGETISECVRVLRQKKAAKIYVIVLAINQFGRNYWNSEPIIACPCCAEKMNLLVNSNNKSFFYMCYQCKKTISYNEARAYLKQHVNHEVEKIDADSDDEFEQL